MGNGRKFFIIIIEQQHPLVVKARDSMSVSIGNRLLSPGQLDELWDRLSMSAAVDRSLCSDGDCGEGGDDSVQSRGNFSHQQRAWRRI